MTDFIEDNFTALLLVSIIGLIIGVVVATIQEKRREKIPPGLDRDIRRIDEDIPPAPGDRRWSNFFGSYIEMVHYSADNLYWFTVLTGVHAGRTYKNQSPWSILPMQKPADYPRRKL